VLLTSIAAQVRQNARTFSDRTAIEVVDGPRVSYAEVWGRVELLAGALLGANVRERGGIRPVAYLLPNGIEAVLVPLACQVASLTAVPLDGRLTTTELTERIEHSGAEVVLSAGAQLDRALALGAEIIDVGAVISNPGADSGIGRVDGGRPLLVGYTSGTTGRPKGALYSGDRLYLDYVRWGWHFGLTDSDTMLTAGPQFHNSYLGLSLLALMVGATNRILTSFDPGVVRDELTGRATFAFLVPSMLDAVLAGWRDDHRPLGAARRILSSGAPVDADLLGEAVHAFPYASIAEAYGWSEGGWVTFEIKRLDRMVTGSVGWPMVGADLVLVGHDDQPVGSGEAGEVAVRGLTPFGGYLHDDDATAASEWRGYHRSGDIGRWLEDGRLYLSDRKKDVIISGGENVYSAEVERVLGACPGVAEAAVVGRPSKRWGEAVVAVVVRDGPLVESEIESYCRRYLAGFKIPKQIEFVDSLPRNAMGKVQKFLLREERRTPQ
jgi:acyl-CoA synthetase (AMP-forming)/AMP-acid ligase II